MIKKFYTSIFTGLFFAGAFLQGCNTAPKTPTAIKDTLTKLAPKEIGIKGSFSPQANIKFDSANITTFLDSFPEFKPFEKDLADFYKSRNYAYAWYDEKGMIENANNLYNRIENISEEGLPDSIPYKNAFTTLMETGQGSNETSPTTELMLTSQYLGYAKKVWVGISEKQSLATDWLLPRKKISSQQLLDSLVNGHNVLENSPMFRQYFLLKAYLKKYSGIKNQGGFTEIRPDKKTYRPGDSSAIISAIRQRLFSLSDLAANNQSNLFDHELRDGVKSLERRLGYREDGVINAVLIKEMNYPIEKRIEQILVNMERCRWVPVNLISDFIVVNIPEFKLRVYAHDSVAFTMNVVVGKEQHKTAIFNGDMKYIVFSPYWNIPASILKKEVLPAIKKDGKYLARHNMEWNNGSVHQKPGPNNSLGLIKFLFPNSHGIYLHDTPAKSLFNESSRAFSHGCIRLAEPKKLAVYLLRNDTAWNENSISAAMNTGIEKYVTLKKTIPVFIAYFTSWVDEEGKLNFRNDIYDRNSRLAKMILEKPAI